MSFTNLKEEGRITTFQLAPTHVTYANTLRRLILTGVETVAFRADMTATGTTTDVEIVRNDTPMTNEMLADRIGLLPIHIQDPLQWKADNYRYRCIFLLRRTNRTAFKRAKLASNRRCGIHRKTYLA